MNQKSQRRFVGPVKVLNDVEIRAGSRGAADRFREALEEIAALLHRRQIQWLRNIGKDSSKPRRELRQFGRVIAHLPAEVVETRRLREIVLDDLDEREIGKR